MRKLHFYLNKKLDERMAEEFLDVQGGGIDFGKGIILTHPKLKKTRFLDTVQRKKFIKDYFNNYYRTHIKAIRQKIKLVKNAWRKYEDRYFTITREFFNDFQFAQGRYIGYASIVDCNPRFLESKTFQFFYKKSIDDIIYTIAHELLHFIFFDFIEQNLKKQIDTLSQDQLWDLSEIFNVIILKSPRYSHIINQHLVRPYPDHIKYIREFEKEYQNSRNAKEFISRGIAIIKTKK